MLAQGACITFRYFSVKLFLKHKKETVAQSHPEGYRWFILLSLKPPDVGVVSDWGTQSAEVFCEASMPLDRLPRFSPPCVCTLLLDPQKHTSIPCTLLVPQTNSITDEFGLTNYSVKHTDLVWLVTLGVTTSVPFIKQSLHNELVLAVSQVPRRGLANEAAPFTRCLRKLHFRSCK